MHTRELNRETIQRDVMDVDKICVFEKNQHQIAFPKSVTYVYNANTCKQGKHKAYVTDVDKNRELK